MKLINSSNKLLSVSLLIIVALTIFYAYRMSRINKLIALQDEVIELDYMKETQLQTKLASLEKIIQEGLYARGNRVNDFELIHLNNGQLKDNYLSELVNNKSLLFFFSRNTCNSCIEEEMANLFQIKENMNPLDIIVVTDYSNEREFRVFTSNYDLNINFVNLFNKDDAYSFFGSSPTVIVVDNELMMLDYFKPLSGDIFTKEYYRTLVEKHFKKP